MSDKPIDQKEINDICWRACDTFRGVIDANEYRDYILLMLFIKYISDVWQEHYAECKKKHKGNKERIKREMALERFVLRPSVTFEKLREKRNADNLGEVIDIAVAAIEDDNKEKLEGVFQNISFNTDQLGPTKERNRLLKNLLEDFAVLDLRPSRIREDIIGEAYMYLIERFGSDAGKKAGEFYTPAPVRRLVAKLAQPQKGQLNLRPNLRLRLFAV